jgi:hypothetical protein
MKRYKIHWHPLNLVSDTQAEVVKLQQIAKGLFGAVTVGTFAAEGSDHAIWVGFVGLVIDLVIGCICLEEVR